MHRRRFLAAVPALLTAGCLGTPAPERGRIGSLVVENRDDSPHTAAVAVDQDGETVLSETFDLAANDDGGAIPADARGSLGPDRLPDERTQYTVHVSLGDDPGAVSCVIPNDAGDGCYLVWFHVTGPDTITPAINNGSDVCGRD